MKSFKRVRSSVSTIEWPSGYDEQKSFLVPAADTVVQLKTYTPSGYIPCDWYTQSSRPTSREEEDKKMAYCCLRSFLTLLHLVMAGAAGFLCIYSIIGWDSVYQCLPQLFNKDQSRIIFNNSLPTVCDFVVFGLSGISLINLLMCVTVNIRWIHTCIIYCNLLLMLIFGTVLTFGSSMFTVHYMLWCDSMQQVYNQSCSYSANYLPSTTGISLMTYKDRLEIQQIIMWALCPVSFILVLAYVLALRLSATSDSTTGPNREQTGSYRYVLMHEETAPLLTPSYHASNGSNAIRPSSGFVSDYWSSQAPPSYPAAASSTPSNTAVTSSASRAYTPIVAPSEDTLSVSTHPRTGTGSSNLYPVA
ncbi:hypothetical protein BgiMline_002297 [Biomphalaria glabrata]|uniref:Uncharacterized protein LOC106062054 isoform X1 n=2 Tax=Biomphalaria glabrata TaxID=6526 RepID=A0A9W3ATS7_BIOGL|nr:uncharacterized protein LOC106062054 isoform X1 [Biomphalaria glabrata]KAI8770143.1 hypothetical protein BgiMline_002166 [Biomphalaria glabrata]